MRAIFLILSLCGILNAASCPNYSSVTALSGFIPAYAALESAGNGYIKDIENYWSSDIKGILDSIKQEIEKKEKLLTQIKNLKKESLLLNKKIEFLLSKETQLLGNLADIESVRE